MGSINGTLNIELYGGTRAVASPHELTRTNVALDGRNYLIDLRQYERRILPAATEQADDGAEGGEQSLSRDGHWARDQSDWSHGAGQFMFDDIRLSTSDRSRFLASRGVNPWVRHRLQLLHDTTLLHASTESNLTVHGIGGYLYVVDGTDLIFSDQPDFSSPTTIVFANTISDIATDTDRVYVAFGGAAALQVVDVGGNTPAALGTETPNILAWANGRLIAAEGGRLYEIDALGTATTIRDDPRGSWTWTAITGHPEAIFAAGRGTGSISEIWATSVDDTGTLVAPVFAGHLRFGEVVHTLTTYSRVLIIGTSDGLRAGTAVNDGVDYGEVIEIPGGVRCLEPQGRFCWFGWSDFDAASAGLGRADLSVSTSPDTFVPAYASDLLAAVPGTVTGVATLLGRRYFTIAGSGLYGESDDLVPEGWLDVGQIRYGTTANKVFTGVDLRFEPLVGQISARSTSPTGVQRSLGVASTTGSVALDAGGVQVTGLFCSLRLTMTRDSDPTTGPVLLSWRMSGLPRPRRVVEIILPIIFKTRVEDLHSIELQFDPLAEVHHLEELASSARLIIFQEGADSRLVRVDQVVVPPGSVRSWQSRRVHTATGIWLELTVFTRLLTREN